ncbi:hypothetical protein [Kordiimonas aquimaris]|uniref:hypothetical protein n=1 Tax=Kordiimonas aquimaris TaxID=707591 RepID=UPI0021D2C65D|nr:hypothetical protein [Kordiimonas aquimaris]
MNFLNANTERQVDYKTSDVSDQMRSLAERLSGHLGLDGAIQISTENQWHGVLSVLLEMKQRRSR